MTSWRLTEKVGACGIGEEDSPSVESYSAGKDDSSDHCAMSVLKLRADSFPLAAPRPTSPVRKHGKRIGAIHVV